MICLFSVILHDRSGDPFKKYSVESPEIPVGVRRRRPGCRARSKTNKYKPSVPSVRALPSKMEELTALTEATEGVWRV